MVAPLIFGGGWVSYPILYDEWELLINDEINLKHVSQRGCSIVRTIPTINIWRIVTIWSWGMSNCRKNDMNAITYTYHNLKKSQSICSLTIPLILLGCQAPIPLTTFRSNSKFDKNLQCSGSKYSKPITTQLCTCHDSNTVVTCAELHCQISYEKEHYKIWIP